jgi:penicillin-binding protein 1A
MLRAFATLVGLSLVIAMAGAAVVVFVFYSYGRDLPDYSQLADHQPKVATRVHAGDGRLLAEYATESRIFVPVRAMPQRVVSAFLSAEDKNFYIHPGVNFLSVARAALTNLRNLGKSRRPVGASTITQQVAKNFLLTNEVSLKRKAKEAILAFRIERAISKDRILELYLNEIFLGAKSYGVAAAALNYFNKSLDELTIAESAFLAGLPKAPNNYQPSRNLRAAIGRRNWVLRRMREDGVITPAEAADAETQPLVTSQRDRTEFVTAHYFSEEVRRQLADHYGEKRLYTGGLSVRTTLDPRLQGIADRALRRGLEAYDRRHGWRGPVNHIETDATWPARLAAVALPKGTVGWELAIILERGPQDTLIGFADGRRGRIPLKELTWARAWAKGEKLGPRVRRPSDVLDDGDVVLVETVLADADGTAYPADSYGLRQSPKIDGALIALDPHTGRILAMSGGYAFQRSQFNRATQAQRQPGSAFKPFVYLAALDAGYSPSTLILDAPFVVDQGPGLPKWRPANYTKKFYGPSTMRLGVEKSRNLMTVRLAQTIGMERVADYAERFGIVDEMPRRLSMSLGAGETTLMRLTAAYAMLVNGGKRIEPTLIDRIQDRDGRTVFRHDARLCTNCAANFWTAQEIPILPDARPSITDPGSAYQVVSMLQGVVQRGTGRRIKAVGKPLAGKTGTTNDSIDAWFLGFSPDLAVGVFTGFDKPRSLGKREQGASVAAPIFQDFFTAALEDRPAIPFRIPPGIRLVRVNASTGELALPGERGVILEAFKPGTEPRGRSPVLEGLVTRPSAGTGGLY